MCVLCIDIMAYDLLDQDLYKCILSVDWTGQSGILNIIIHPANI